MPGKNARKQYRLKQRAKQSAKKAQYQALAAAGRNQKVKGSGNTSGKKIVHSKSHPYGACANVGCRACFPEISAARTTREIEAVTSVTFNGWEPEIMKTISVTSRQAKNQLSQKQFMKMSFKQSIWYSKQKEQHSFSPQENRKALLTHRYLNKWVRRMERRDEAHRVIDQRIMKAAE